MSAELAKGTGDASSARMRPLYDVQDVCEIYAGDLDHPECITRGPDGRLFAGGEAGQIYVVGVDGVKELARVRGSILGVVADASGALYACDGKSACVWQIDRDSGRSRIMFEGDGVRRLVLPNYACFAPDGTLFVSDSGARRGRDGCIWMLRSGDAQIWSTDVRDFPNGLAVSADGRFLFVIASFPGAVMRLGIGEDGLPCSLEKVVDVPGVPDGIAIASDGSLVIGCYRPDALYRYREDLGLQLLLHDPEGYFLAAPTNLAFDGADLETLVVANFARRHLTRCAIGLKGQRLHYPDVIRRPLSIDSGIIVP